MDIRESIVIKAPLATVWSIFNNLVCWKEWNTVLKDVTAPLACISEGGEFRCCITPFTIPLYFSPQIEEVVPEQKVVWTGEKYGISSRHEFLFEDTAAGVVVTSRETFHGLPLTVAGRLFPKGKLRELTIAFLEDLRDAAESAR